MDFRGLEDCFYFLQGGCTNASCVYRHSAISKESDIYCQGWQQFTCYDIKCPHRHSSIPVRKTQTSLSHNISQQEVSHAHIRVSEATINFDPSDLHPKEKDTSCRKSAKARAICKYNLHGKCTKGDACTFLHSTDQSQSKDIPTLDSDMSLPQSSISSVLSTDKVPLAPDISLEASLGVTTDGGSKRKGRDILDRYSFRKTIKLDESAKKMSIERKIKDSSDHA